MFGKKIKCPVCGGTVTVKMRFCPSCGQELMSKDAGGASSGNTEKIHILPEVGAHLFFGRYQGDDIEWVVLDSDAEKHRSLLFCAYSIELAPYHGNDIAITWKLCDLRKWLNDGFMHDSFTKGERARICPVLLKNPGCGDEMGCGDTEDSVFLLSIEEAQKYPLPKDYNLSNNVKNEVKRNYVRENLKGYWLRTCAKYLSWYNNKDVSVKSMGSTNERGCVRPAIWVKF